VQISVYNGLTKVQSWAFDANPNQSYDPLAYVTSCSQFNVGNTAPNNLPCDISVPTATAEYNLNQNNGSGKPDYFLIPVGFDFSRLASFEELPQPAINDRKQNTKNIFKLLLLMIILFLNF